MVRTPVGAAGRGRSAGGAGDLSHLGGLSGRVLVRVPAGIGAAVPDAGGQVAEGNAVGAADEGGYLWIIAILH